MHDGLFNLTVSKSETQIKFLEISKHRNVTSEKIKEATLSSEQTKYQQKIYLNWVLKCEFTPHFDFQNDFL